MNNSWANLKPPEVTSGNSNNWSKLAQPLPNPSIVDIWATNTAGASVWGIGPNNPVAIGVDVASTALPVENLVTPELKVRLITENLPQTNDGILMLWAKVKQSLAAIKEDEMSLRKITVKLFVPNPNEGTNNIDLGSGYSLKAGISFDYSLDTNIEKVSEVQDKIATIGNQGPEIAAKIFKWTADLVLSEYRALEQFAPNFEDVEQIKRLVDSVLVKKEKAPTLDLKPPKEKK